MKNSIRNSVYRLWLAFPLLAALVLAVGCVTPTHEPNPLLGWKLCWSQNPDKLDKEIVDDYQDYIQKLPPKERLRVNESNIRLLEDLSGQYAVKISISLRGFWSDIWWDHILVYDTNNKRIRTMKYKSGRSLS